MYVYFKFCEDYTKHNRCRGRSLTGHRNNLLGGNEMKKRVLCVLLCFAMTLMLATACSKSSGGSGKVSNKPVTIHILMGASQYLTALNDEIKEYERETPNVTIQLQSQEDNLNTILKSDVAAGNIPDAFQTTNGPELQEYAMYSADLTNTPLAKAMLPQYKESMTYNGKVIGIPFEVDEIALVYNKAIFKAAGITDMPLTLSALETDAVKIQNAGYTPFDNLGAEWWSYKYVLSFFEAAAAPNHDVQKLQDEFNSGTTTFAKNSIMMNYFKLTDMFVKYGGPKPLQADYNSSISNFTSGKYAIMTAEGTPGEQNVLTADPSIQLGVIPYPVSEDPSQASMSAAVGQCLRISKSSKVLAQTEAFYNWEATSDWTKNTWYPMISGFVPPYKGVAMPGNSQVAKAYQDLVTTQKIPSYDLACSYSDDGANQKIGDIMQAYIAGTESQNQAVNDIQQAWIQLGDPNKKS